MYRRPTLALLNWRFPLVACGLLFAASAADAQLTRPSAARAVSPAAPTAAAKQRKPGARAAGKAKGGSFSAPGLAGVDGRPLRLNGKDGMLMLSGSGATLTVAELRLAGESVSNPSQRCIVDIVGEKPIEARSEGRPDGLERYDIGAPACPFAFDVLDRAVLAPPQITACVFKAADCQTSPGGLWGPDATELGKDAAEIGKRRVRAETAMSKALSRIEKLAADNPDAAALLRDQKAFPGEREDTCKDYVKESDHGFCAASLTEARAALLEARLTGFSPSAAERPDAAKAEKRSKKNKPRVNAAKP